MKMIEDKEENLKWGSLTLQIYCEKCEKTFELNPASIAIHLAVNASIWDYIKWVQLSDCSNCKEKLD
jgi:hypothetical protein